MANVKTNEQRNKRILESWLRMIKTDTCNKTMLGSNFDVSPRTVGRILQSFGLSGNETEDREILDDLGASEYEFNSDVLEEAYIDIYLEPTEAADDDEDEEYDGEYDDEDTDYSVYEEHQVSGEESSDDFMEDDESEFEEQAETEGEFITEATIDPSMTILDFTIARKYINIILETTETVSISDTDDRFDQLRQLLIDGEDTAALELVSEKAKIVGWSGGSFRIKDNQLMMNGERVTHSVSELVLDAFEMGRPFVKFLKFYEKLQNNPSFHSVKQMVPFMRHNDIDITEDGDVIAWKVVTNDYKDCHSNTFDNSIGTVVKMKRNEVNDDPQQTCSEGLHICAKSYIGSFKAGTNRVVKVHVDPADIVSVPNDYNGAKCRCCKYTVVADVTE